MLEKILTLIFEVTMFAAILIFLSVVVVSVYFSIKAFHVEKPLKGAKARAYRRKRIPRR